MSTAVTSLPTRSACHAPCCAAARRRAVVAGCTAPRAACKRSSVLANRGIAPTTSIASLRPRQRGLAAPRQVRVRAEAAEDGSDTEKAPAKNTEFGRSRKDVLIISFGITVVGYALKTGLTVAGVDEIQAGNWTTAFVMVAILMGYLSTYLFRVGRKEMTYIGQLRDYEMAVMEKRLEEMPPAEMEKLMEDVDEIKQRRQ
mmetsp:Transcript_12306/g.44874  ORF Transcript_12306/g.44874 Transcript_12306/m.44874 type:complete len:200 (+) Transcript_12306:59-658(+)